MTQKSTKSSVRDEYSHRAWNTVHFYITSHTQLFFAILSYTINQLKDIIIHRSPVDLQTSCSISTNPSKSDKATSSIQKLVQDINFSHSLLGLTVSEYKLATAKIRTTFKTSF